MGLEPPLRAAIDHYRRAERGVLRAERSDALHRAEAAFQVAAETLTDPPLKEWCARQRRSVRALREQLELGGIDDLPPLEPLP